jgi:hypothetical protein
MALFKDVCALRREIAFANPLLDFDTIVYSTGGGYGGLFHTGPMPRAYYINHVQPHRQLDDKKKRRLNWWTAEHWRGGFDFSEPVSEEPAQEEETFAGLFSATGWRDGKVSVRHLLDGVVITNGRYNGERLTAFRGEYHHAFDVSYDGEELLVTRALGEAAPYHIFRINLEAGQARQLTDGFFADQEACFLPNGRIAFTSYRRWIAARCQSNYPQPCATLFSMDGDGSDLYPISWHETSERFPQVDNDGRLVYTRWDYVDRGTYAAHHIWRCGPDGRNPRAPHGNYPLPYGNPPGWAKDIRDGIVDRPYAEFHIRPIPGEQGRYVAVAGVHHGCMPGSVIIIDTSVSDDNRLNQVKFVKGQAYPYEQPALKHHYPPEARYMTPWPLSGSYFIVTRAEKARARSKPEGIYLLDKFGNCIMLISEPGLGARPLQPRPRPPIIPTQTWQGEREGQPGHRRAVVSIMDAYEADMPWPENTQLKEIRVIQLLCLPWGGYNNDRDKNWHFRKEGGHGWVGTSPRMVLGTAPIEEDGSAYFEAPVGKEIYFQVVDENGMAVQSMRSGTYVHPGEHLSCIGCHEKRSASIMYPDRPKAIRRAPSRLRRPPEGHVPFSYARAVQPIVETKCLPCHQEKKRGPQTSEYEEWWELGFFYRGTGDHRTGHRTIPGEFGARASRIGKALHEGHQERVTEEDRRKIYLWIDANTMEMGAFYNHAAQKAGEVVWPLIDVDPTNPIGVERDRPLTR